MLKIALYAMVKIKKLHYCCVFFIVVIAFSIYGCKNEQDLFPEPKVLITKPQQNELFNVFDSVKVNALIQHYKEIRQVSVLITDANQKPISTTYTYQVNKEAYTLESSVLIDNKYLEGSIFYVLIKVDDGVNLYNHWHPIGINAFDKRLESLLIITANEGWLKLYHSSLYGDLKHVEEWNSDYLGGYTDSKNRIFYTSGRTMDGVRSIPLDSANIAWKVLSGISPLAMNTAFTGMDGRVAVSTFQGEIIGFNSYGNINFTSERFQNGLFKRIMILNNFVVGYFEPSGGLNNEIYVFNFPAGNVYAYEQKNFKVIDFIEVDENNFYIVADKGGTIELYSYNISEKKLSFKSTLTYDKVNQVSGDKTDIFLLTENGMLWHRIDQPGSVMVVNMADIQVIRYSGLEKLLFTGIDNKVMFYKLPDGLLTNMITLEHYVSDINLLYNK